MTRASARRPVLAASTPHAMLRTSPPVRAARRALLTAFLLVAGTLGLATPAGADEAGTISRMDVVATVRPDGAVDVTLDLDLDLGGEEAHGPYLVLAELQEIVGDPDHYRRMTIDGVTATSTTGAPDDLRVEREDGGVALYIGDEDVEITGRHGYRVGYTVTGLVNPDVDGTDQLFWNVVAPGGFEIDLSDVTVAVTGPDAPERVECYVGRTGSTQPCDAADLRGGTSRFAQSALDPGEGLTVLTAWPAGTVPGAEVELAHRPTLANVVQLDPVTGAITGIGTLLGVGAAVSVATRRGRDEAYLDVVPGLVPADDATARVGRRRRKPVAVQFTPPPGVRPGEIGTLVDEVADPEDVSATLVDLAVRGFVRIEERHEERRVDDGAEGDGAEDADGAPTDWYLVRLAPAAEAGLEPYERELLATVFADDDAITVTAMAQRHQETMTEMRKRLYAVVTARGWFRADPSRVRARWLGWGTAVLLTGIVAGVVLALVRLPVVYALAPVAIGIAMIAVHRMVPARTAQGTAVLAQTLGFRRYLETAEAERVRFELADQPDLFSRYLPYAMVFGLTERWAGVFAELERGGHRVAEPSWYVGAHGPAGLWANSALFVASFDAFTTAASGAVTAASTGAAGGSGFSVGAGVGGTGGGSW